jgi:ribose-phosphate pyrophosphokinase
MNDCYLFSGNGSSELGKLIASNTSVGISLGEIDHVQFPSGEWYCQIKNNIRGSDVFLLNSTTNPANDNLMQLLIMADAARRASAGRITAVIPFFGYSRQDRKDKSRVPISAKLVMDIIEAAGVNRVVTMDLHAQQIQGFTNLPFDHLQFRPSLLNALKGFKIDVIVAPDVGAVKKGEAYARELNIDLAILSKRRMSSTMVEIQHFIGDVQNKNVLILDDLTESAGTLTEAAMECKKNGAKEVYCAITHGCFTDAGNTRLTNAFENGIITRMFVSNTVETKLTGQWINKESASFRNKVTRVNVAPIFAKAIQSIHNDESVSSLFV